MVSVDVKPSVSFLLFSSFSSFSCCFCLLSFFVFFFQSSFFFLFYFSSFLLSLSISLSFSFFLTMSRVHSCTGTANHERMLGVHEVSSERWQRNYPDNKASHFAWLHWNAKLEKRRPEVFESFNGCQHQRVLGWVYSVTKTVFIVESKIVSGW